MVLHSPDCTLGSGSPCKPIEPSTSPGSVNWYQTSLGRIKYRHVHRTGHRKPRYSTPPPPRMSPLQHLQCLVEKGCVAEPILRERLTPSFILYTYPFLCTILPFALTTSPCANIVGQCMQGSKPSIAVMHDAHSTCIDVLSTTHD